MDNCPICMYELSSDKGISITSCGHRFCTKCLADSILKSNRNCPMWRTPITEDVTSFTQEDVDHAYHQGMIDYGEESYHNGYDDCERKWRKKHNKLTREKKQIEILYKYTVIQLQTTNTRNQVIPKIKRTLSE